MTNYNDGNWWGWNGGECPVHPRSVVEIVYHDDGEYLTNEAIADHCEWNEGCDNPIIAFRVVKEHKDPREFWLLGDYRFYSMEDAEEELRKWGIDEEIIHVREVL